MNITHYTIAFYFVVTVYCLRLSNGYVMPVCSEYGGVCVDRSDCDVKSTTKKSNYELFSFMDDVMEVMRNWIYNEIFGVYNRSSIDVKEPPMTYTDIVWNFFGFPPDSHKQKEMDYSSCNTSVLGIILMFYFGYVFMATKYLTANKRPFLKRLVSYLWNNSNREDDEELYSDDDSCLQDFGKRDCCRCINEEEET